MTVVVKGGAWLLASTALSLWCGTALAQDGSVAAAETSAGGLEEIVVTAQKRAENLQDTPLAVSALTSQTLEARRISDISGITAAAPNLTTTITPSSTANIAVHIRGIGESDPVLTVDSPVSVYLDGVVIGRSAGAIFDLVDLERVEVLRGPQGTLYGRNTTGGAVNFITAKPADAFKASFGATYGRFNDIQTRASVDTGELGDSGLRFKLSYAHKQRDGYADDLNQPDANDPGAYNVDAFRIAARLDRGGPLRIDYAFDYNDSKSYSVPFQLAAVRADIAAYLSNSEALGGNPLVYSRDRLNKLRLQQGQLRDEVMGHNLTVEYDLASDLTLRSITGYRQWVNSVARTDLDGNDGLAGFTVSPAILVPPNRFIPTGVREVDLFAARNNRRQEQVSQEINLLGNFGDTVEYVVGGFYFREKARENNPQELTLVLRSPASIPLGNGVSTDYFGVPLAPQLAYRHSSESIAGFAQATFHVTDRFNVTGGIRYTEDQKHLDQSAAIVRDLRSKYNRFNWAASADYKITDDVLFYARVATGYKAGGFNPRSVGGSFDPEDILSYEAGLKTELFDRRLRFNLTGFHSRYKDLQVSQFLAGSGGASSITVNAGKATYTGVEVEATAEPVDGLTLNATGGYVDRKFKSFVIRNAGTNQLEDVADEARFHYSPSTTANAGIQYEYGALSFGKILARLDWTYRSRIYFHPLDRLNPFNEQISDGSVGRFDARLAVSELELGGSRATVALWGKNITNEDYLYSGIDFGSLGFAGIVYAEPRTYGIDLRLDF
ncbi:iron complex outermembrane recepter protein [Sphingomonas laterariae]|uniref:Iron complex outermembrane recepter protein n=1 Tax=Edaphosphingomonas laterariae TaxID=861865 RepID=A0A239BFU7_9SPHN|nr:TonB-dependent receptor [Sphingomonas laterariae]SNS06218.1 iron complex outermembrane recepter protein [Sphingomonas laterariae]